MVDRETDPTVMWFSQGPNKENVDYDLGILSTGSVFSTAPAIRPWGLNVFPSHITRATQIFCATYGSFWGVWGRDMNSGIRGLTRKKEVHWEARTQVPQTCISLEYNSSKCLFPSLKNKKFRNWPWDKVRKGEVGVGSFSRTSSSDQESDLGREGRVCGG